MGRRPLPNLPHITAIFVPADLNPTFDTPCTTLKLPKTRIGKPADVPALLMS